MDYKAEISLNGTLKESFTYVLESSDKYQMLYRNWQLPLSQSVVDRPYAELLDISVPEGTTPYLKDWLGNVTVFSENGTSPEIESLAEANEAGCYNAGKFPAGAYQMDYVFQLHWPVNCDNENCQFSLKLADKNLAYQNVAVTIYDPENLTIEIVPYSAMNLTRQGDAWVMTGQIDRGETLGLDILLRPDSAQEPQGFINYSFDEEIEDQAANLTETDLIADYDYYYDLSSELPAAEITSFAFPVSDLNGDSAWDILNINITNADADSTTSEISAISGSDGTVLWLREYSDALAFASPAGDLNNDGQNDVMVNVILGGTTFIPYSEVAALNGGNGTEIWSRGEILAATLAYPLRDLTGDNATDVVVHVFGIDSLNNSLITEICALNGTDGTEIDSRVFPAAIAVEYPAGNLTSDDITDNLRGIYRINEEESDVATTIVAVNGSDLSDLWSTAFYGCLAIAIPCTDLTGDGHDDVLAYIMTLDGDTGTEINLQIALLQGSSGEVLWKRDYGSSLAVAFARPDLTGDGVQDLIIYKMGSGDDGDSGIEALKGDNGTLLWTRPSMILMPI